MRRRAHSQDGVRRGGELEARRKLGTPQNTKGIFDKDVWLDGVKPAILEVCRALERIDEHTVCKAARYHVDAKISPAEVLFDRYVRRALDREVSVTWP